MPQAEFTPTFCASDGGILAGTTGLGGLGIMVAVGAVLLVEHDQAKSRGGSSIAQASPMRMRSGVQ